MLRLYLWEAHQMLSWAQDQGESQHLEGAERQTVRNDQRTELAWAGRRSQVPPCPEKFTVARSH